VNAIEKILASHAGLDSVSPGDVVVVEVDMAVLIDPPFSMPGMQPDLSAVFDPDKIALVADHLVPAPTPAAANGLRRMRQFAERFGIAHVYLEGAHGISHVLAGDRGLALPGGILACADSHTCSAGAVNCVARGLGISEMVYVACTGQTWFLVAPTNRVEVVGALGPRVSARDVVHHLAAVHGEFAGENLEWHGPGLASIGMAGRFTLATMSAELSAEFSLFPFDEVLESYVAERASRPFTPAAPDPDAVYARTLHVDLSALGPQVVLPGKVPHNAVPVEEAAGTPIDQAYIGSCANARFEDLAEAAAVVRGRTVASGTRFVVTPSSQEHLRRAVEAGHVATLMDAGAVVTSSTCGACFGLHMGVLGDGETCITSSTRNFEGRMGSPTARIYMGSPATVAASAVAGVIADPRDL
jgi:3-isopropylmalate/(R)-2-methylmalate dehydratase large subunit